MSTLIIHNVSFKRLKKQTKRLSKLVSDPIFNDMTPKEQECLEGILLMLWDWSDRRKGK